MNLVAGADVRELGAFFLGHGEKLVLIDGVEGQIPDRFAVKANKRTGLVIEHVDSSLRGGKRSLKLDSRKGHLNTVQAEWITPMRLT